MPRRASRHMPSKSGILIRGPSTGEFVRGMHLACALQGGNEAQEIDWTQHINMF